MAVPSYIAWIADTEEVIETADGMEIEVWELNHVKNSSILSDWARHFRQHYCKDADLKDLVSGTGLTSSEFLTSIKFPDATKAPGPSTRAGDFGEILVADFVEYVLGYWCPREGRYENRDNRSVPSNGCDILGFKFADDESWSKDDELFLLESKVSLTPTKKNRMQQAIDGSVKDMTREAMSLNAIKQRLLRINYGDALKVQRFQSINDRPFRRISGAAAILEEGVMKSMKIEESDCSEHPNADNLRLIIIKGVSLMSLMQELYVRAANEA